MKIISQVQAAELAKKAREILKKIDSKVNLASLIVAAALAFGGGMYVATDHTSDYNISQLYVGTYTDYYGDNQLAILVKKENPDSDKKNYYEELNGAFNSKDMSLEDIRLLYTCLSEEDLKQSREKGNDFSVRELNHILDNIKEKDQSMNNKNNSGKVEANPEEKKYSIKSYYIGVYNDATGQWKCDAFKYISDGRYCQYQGAYNADTFSSTKNIQLVDVKSLVTCLTPEEIAIANKNGGLSEKEVQNVLKRVSDLISKNEYKPLNDYLARTTAPVLGNDGTDDQQIYSSELLNFVIYQDDATHEQKAVIRDSLNEQCFDNSGLVASIEMPIIYEENIDTLLGINGFFTEAEAEAIIKFMDEEFLNVSQIQELYDILNRIEFERFKSTQVNDKDMTLSLQNEN